jgi:hypothetical protein
MSSGASKINLEASDRGLLMCLMGARLTEIFSRDFMVKYHMETLDDFVHYVSKEKAVEELDLLQKAFQSPRIPASTAPD